VQPGIDLRPSQIRAERNRAIWLGMTAAILTIVGLLNALPSNPVLYKYEARIFASPIRVEKLRQLAAETQASDKSVGKPAVKHSRVLVVTQVESIKGDGPAPKLQVTNADSGSRMEGVRVVCFSASRKSPLQLQNLLQTVSEPERFVRGDSGEAAKLRWARWRLETAQHSLKLITEELAAISTGATTNEALMFADSSSESPSSPFQLTSTNTGSNQNDDAASVEDKIEQLRKIESELQTGIDAEQKTIDSLQQTVAKLQAQSKGFLTLSSEPTMRPETRPVGMGAALILIAISSFAGLLLARTYFRGAIPSTMVVQSLPQQLEILGIAFLGTMSNPSAPVRRTKVIAARWNYAVWLARSTDALFVLCVIAIATRAVQDPQWRVFLASNPLPALAHLIRGL
jgi:hypothetical protein